jgi:hypothetical protein
MRGRYQRRRSTRDWVLELFTYLFIGMMLVSCFLCVALYGAAHIK